VLVGVGYSLSEHVLGLDEVYADQAILIDLDYAVALTDTAVVGDARVRLDPLDDQAHVALGVGVVSGYYVDAERLDACVSVVLVKLNV